MGLKNDYLYHPFTHSELGFFMRGAVSNGNDTHFLLKSIDLYYQPVEEPVFAIMYLVVGLIMFVVGEMIQFKLLFMVKRENGLIKEVTQVYSITSIIMYPFWLFVPTITDFIHPLNEVIGDWFCFIARWLTLGYFLYIWMQSFIVAMMRYWFIVKEESVKKYGKEKTKRVFLYLSIFLPVMIVLWSIAENIELDLWLFVNRCYGIDHRMFLINVAPDTASNPKFCQIGTFDDKDLNGKILVFIERASCFFKAIVTFVLTFNITEGILYYKIFSHLKRFAVFNLLMEIIVICLHSAFDSAN